MEINININVIDFSWTAAAVVAIATVVVVVIVAVVVVVIVVNVAAAAADLSGQIVSFVIETFIVLLSPFHQRLLYICLSLILTYSPFPSLILFRLLELKPIPSMAYIVTTFTKLKYLYSLSLTHLQTNTHSLSLLPLGLSPNSFQ